MERTDNFVIDTNTLISSLLLKNSTPYRAMEKAREKGRLIFSEECFLEFESVLFREKFDKYFSYEERLQTVERVMQEATFIQTDTVISECRDLSDNKYLELAVEGHAACIITGDPDLLVLHPFRNIPILNSRDFLLQF